MVTDTAVRRGRAAAPKAAARLLVVDDDPEVRRLVGRLLQAEGYEVECASTGAELMDAVADHAPDLVLLDVLLGTENGFELLAGLRRVSRVPVIMLTGREAETDRVLGLRLGADDYVTKPFSSAELAARVASVLRRLDQHQAPEGEPLRFGELTIDLRTRELKVSRRLVATTAKEFDLIAFMAASPRQVFSREQLLSQVWSSSSDWQDSGTVTEHVRRLRRKIEPDPKHPRWLRTVRGVGYRFEP